MSEDIVSRIGLGDKQAVVEVFDTHGEALLHSAIAVTLDLEYAFHACEKIFVNLMSLVRQERPNDQGIRKLLFHALHAEINHSSKDRRMSQKPVSTHLLIPVVPTLPQGFVDRTEEMLQRLKEPEREVLIFKAYGGLSLADIADITTERFDIVERRHSDAVKRALEVLKPPEGEPDDVDLWLKRVKLRQTAAGFRARAIQAFLTRRMGRALPKKRVWLVIALFVLAGLGVALKILGDLQVSWLRDFFK